MAPGLASRRSTGSSNNIAAISRWAVRRGTALNSISTFLEPQNRYHMRRRSPMAHLPKGVLIVVEDEETVRLLVTETLKDSSYVVEEAADGAEGLALVTRHGDACRLVISDVIMPGMSGPAMVQRLRSTMPNVKVLFLS